MWAFPVLNGRGYGGAWGGSKYPGGDRYGRLGGRQGHAWEMRSWSPIPILHFSCLNSTPIPSQQDLGGVQVWLLNAKLVCHRVSLLCDLIAEKKAELACITKTRFGPEEEGALLEICPTGFGVRHQSWT